MNDKFAFEVKNPIVNLKSRITVSQQIQISSIAFMFYKSKLWYVTDYSGYVLHLDRPVQANSI